MCVTLKLCVSQYVCLPQCCVSLFSVCVSFSVCVTLSVFLHKDGYSVKRHYYHDRSMHATLLFTY